MIIAKPFLLPSGKSSGKSLFARSFYDERFYIINIQHARVSVAAGLCGGVICLAQLNKTKKPKIP